MGERRGDVSESVGAATNFSADDSRGHGHVERFGAVAVGGIAGDADSMSDECRYFRTDATSFAAHYE